MDIAARIFFERSYYPGGQRIDCMTEADALELVRSGRVKGWHMGVGLFTSASPSASATERQIATAALPGDSAYHAATRAAWRRVAAEHYSL